jgi:hypothetical protein
MLEHEHRSSMGRSHYIISDKCYVSIMLQSSEEQKNDEKKIKVRKIGRIK